MPCSWFRKNKQFYATYAELTEKALMSSAEWLIAGKALLFFALPLAIGVWEWYQLRRVTRDG